MQQLISFLAAAVYLLATGISPAVAAESQPPVIVRGRTIVAFFPPTSEAELQKDTDTNEALADFQLYAARVRDHLKKVGIDFHELYVRSFRVRVGKTVTTFHPVKTEVGYYFIAPGKEPRIEYGVMTDIDILQVANEYFGAASGTSSRDARDPHH